MKNGNESNCFILHFPGAKQWTIKFFEIFELRTGDAALPYELPWCAVEWFLCARYLMKLQLPPVVGASATKCVNLKRDVPKYCLRVERDFH